MKISLDSNVFADIDFIDWLQENNRIFEVSISVICALETFHWYNIRGLSKNLFNKDLEAIGITIQDLTFDNIYEISDHAKKSVLPFKHHARDFIIGTHSMLNQSRLITNNLKHFYWIGKENLSTPDKLVLDISKTE